MWVLSFSSMVMSGFIESVSAFPTITFLGFLNYFQISVDLLLIFHIIQNYLFSHKWVSDNHQSKRVRNFFCFVWFFTI